MDCFHAILNVTHIDGTQENLQEETPLEADRYFVLSNMELDYTAVVLSLWLSWDGETLSIWYEDLLNPSDALR